MTYLDLIQAAKPLANASPLSESYVRDWNALQDVVLGKLSIAEVETLRANIAADRHSMPAQVLLCMLDD